MKSLFVVMLTLLSPVTFAEDGLPSVVGMVEVAPAWSGHSVGYCLLTQSDHQFLAYYDHQQRMVVASRRLESTTWKFKRLNQQVNWDSHHYITMAMDKAGHLHVSGNMHSDPLIYYRSEAPYDIDSLTRMKSMVGQDEVKCTYPQFLLDATGELYFIYRSGKSGDGVQLVNRYDVEAAPRKSLVRRTRPGKLLSRRACSGSRWLLSPHMGLARKRCLRNEPPSMLRTLQGPRALGVSDGGNHCTPDES